MGRKRKQGLKYFPFDVDFFSDEKTVCIAGEFGLKGEITMIKLLCAVYRNGYFLEWNEVVKLKFLHSLPGVSADLLNQILDRLVKWGFFCRSLFDSAKVLTSEGIQRRYFDAIKFRNLPDELPHLLIDNFKNYQREIDFPKENPLFPKENVDFTKGNAPNKIKVNKKNNKKRNSEITKSSLSAEETQFMSLKFEDKMSILKSDDAWKNSMCENFHLTEQELLEIIDTEFAIQCVIKGYNEGLFRLSDLKRQVSTWMTKRKNNRYEANQTDKFSERRGTEPTAKSRKDFNGTF